MTRTDATPSETIARIWDLLLAGHTVTATAAAVGVSDSIVSRISRGTFGYPERWRAATHDATPDWVIDFDDYVAVNRAASEVPHDGRSLTARIFTIASLAHRDFRTVCLALGFCNHPVAR